MAIAASKWGRPGSVPTDYATKTELYLHHTVSSDLPRSPAEERAHLRELALGHIARGFSTIGYSWILFRSGRLYEGRGLRGYPAAQGGHNTGTWAIAYVGDLRTDRMTRRAKLRFISAAIYLRVRHGARWYGGHREAPGLRESTECPAVGGLRFVHGTLKRAGLTHVSKRGYGRVGQHLSEPEQMEANTGTVCAPTDTLT